MNLRPALSAAVNDLRQRLGRHRLAQVRVDARPERALPVLRLA